MSSEHHPHLASGDPRDMVYELRRRAAELHTRAARIEARAWELNRELALQRAQKDEKPCR